MDQIRVRFAPSPTGYLHIGGARTALYNWLFARKHGGTFVLRIEDTDSARSTDESIAEIIDGLTGLGLNWDEGPFYQSQRVDTHQQAAQTLLKRGAAYKCFCTREEIDAKREQARRTKTDYKYDGTCRELSAAQIAEREAQGMASVIRFKVPRGAGSVAFEDTVYGRIEKAYADIEDFVIMRSDGRPLYILSSAVDDITDRITHVIRGQDGLGNTPKQLLLYDALGCTPPAYAHISLTLDPCKAKISKRKHGEVVTVAYYRAHGMLPWALCNFLALLGWSPGDDREFFSRDELIETFSLQGIARHNAIFNYDAGSAGRNWTDPKAISMNARYLGKMPLDELLPAIRPELEAAGLWDPAYETQRQEWFRSAVELLRTRLHTITEFATLGRPYFSDDFDMDAAAVKKNLRKDPHLPAYLRRAADALEQTDTFSLDSIEQTLRDICAQLEIKPGLLINAIRTAVTGQAAGPGLFELLHVIGRDKTVARVRAAAEEL